MTSSARVLLWDCRKCGKVKSEEAFSRNKNKPLGRNTHCKKCIWESQRVLRYKQIYGITVEDYERMFSSQEGVCAICSNGTKNRLAVDHDHQTGAVRGLLCPRCNQHLEWTIDYNKEIGNYLGKS